MTTVRNILLLALIALSNICLAQYDEFEEVSPEQLLKRGLFMTFQDFRKNTPVAEENINTPLNPEERNFYYNLLKETRINIHTANSTYSIKPSKVWGYFDGKGLYINRRIFPSSLGLLEPKDVSDHLWADVVDMGAICLIYYNKNFKPELSITRTGSMMKKNQAMLFFLDARDGAYYKATSRNLESLISDDAEISREFKSYRGDNEEKMYVFLKKYNQKHKLVIQQ